MTEGRGEGRVLGAGGGGSCIDRRRLLSCAPAARASPFAAPPSSRTEAPSPRPGPRATTDRIDHRHGGGEGRKGMLRCERDPQNAARRRVHTRAPCYRPRHTISVAAPVNESGDLYPLAREPPRLDSPGLSLKTIRRPLLLSLSLSLVGERVQRPTRIHTPNPSPPGATRRYRLPLPRLLSPPYTCVRVCTHWLLRLSMRGSSCGFIFFSEREVEEGNDRMEGRCVRREGKEIGGIRY